VVSGVTGTVVVTYTGVGERPQDKLAINEIMYNPTQPQASYVEIYNRSRINAFDLSGWRLDGADFRFGPGVWIPANSYRLIVQDRLVTLAPSVPWRE